MGFKDVVFRDQKHVEALYAGYLEHWKRCVESFLKGMEVFLEQGLTEEFAYWVENTHKLESLADDRRREIEIELYSKALLPESREDILNVLETIDKVINKVESVLYQIHLEGILLPDLVVPSIQRIAKITRECLDLVYQAASQCFQKQSQILKLSKEIDQKESECDHAERDVLKKLFASDLEWFRKLQVKNLIIELGNITDRAETVSDRLVITSVKRRV